MVERVERPGFPNEEPKQELAPEFPGVDRSSSSEHDPAGSPSATAEIKPVTPVSSPEPSLPSDGEPEVPDHDQTVGFEEISKGEDTLADQDTVNAGFKREANS